MGSSSQFCFGVNQLWKNAVSQGLSQGVNKSSAHTKQVWVIYSLSVLCGAEECKWFMIKTSANHSLCHVCLRIHSDWMANSLTAHEPTVGSWRLILRSKMLVKRLSLLRRWPGTGNQKENSASGSHYMNRSPHRVEQHIIIKGFSLPASVKDVLNLVIER